MARSFLFFITKDTKNTKISPRRITPSPLGEGWGEGTWCFLGVRGDLGGKKYKILSTFVTYILKDIAMVLAHRFISVNRLT